MNISRSNRAQLHAEERSCKQNERQPDVHQPVQRILDGPGQPHDEGDDELRGARDQGRRAENVNHPRHTDKAAYRNRAGENAGRETERNGE